MFDFYLLCSINRYNEIALYQYGNPVFANATGHFTQLVWAGTTQVGVAIVRCANLARTYVVAQYSPAGNREGEFSANVMMLRQGQTLTVP